MWVRANNCVGSPTPPSWDVEIAKYAALAYVSYNVSIRATAARQLISTPFPSSDAFWVPIWPILWVRPHVCNHDHNLLLFFCIYSCKNQQVDQLTCTRISHHSIYLNSRCLCSFWNLSLYPQDVQECDINVCWRRCRWRRPFQHVNFRAAFFVILLVIRCTNNVNNIVLIRY